MKMLIFSTVLFLSLNLPAQKIKTQRFSQPAAPAASYNLTFNVMQSELRHLNGILYLHLEGALNDSHIALEGGPSAGGLYGLLPVGDYRVRLSGEDKHKDGTVERQYDLLLANGRHEYLMLSGMAK
jgi:hypothetical protein